MANDEDVETTPTRLDPLHAMQFRVALPLQVKGPATSMTAASE
jgi:hypothetical protein